MQRFHNYNYCIQYISVRLLVSKCETDKEDKAYEKFSQGLCSNVSEIVLSLWSKITFDKSKANKFMCTLDSKDEQLNRK